MTTGTILDKILDAKRVEVARHKRETPLAELEERVKRSPFPLNLSGALRLTLTSDGSVGRSIDRFRREIRFVSGAPT